MRGGGRFTFAFGLTVLGFHVLGTGLARAEEAVSSFDEIELSAEEAALLQELEGEVGETQVPSLSLYGFADLGMASYVGVDSTVGAFSPLSSRATTVAVGNLNLYLDANLTHGFSFLAEVRLHFAPMGNTVESDFTDATTRFFADSVATDATADFSREFDYGFIELERVYAAYSFSDWLNVRAGLFLTPYGVWNVDHGSPVIIPTQRPYIIGDQFIPERQAGIEVFGVVPVEDWHIGYHLYMSNGRGPVSSILDLDDHLAWGGRLYLDTRALGHLTLGGSAYNGTRVDQRVTLVPESLAAEPALRRFEYERSE